MINHIRQSNLIENIDNTDEDKQSIRAWNYLKKQNHLTQNNILRTHRLITLNQLPKEVSGKFRTVNVMVGGSLMPAHYLIKSMIDDWLTDMMLYENSLSPMEMHIRFEKIHPFIDGNGRTGRLLLWWHELKQGNQPTLILNETKHTEYYPLFN